MTQEETDLSTHVSLCHLRYTQLEQRLNAVETRLSKIEADMSSLKASTQQGFSEIKLLIAAQNNSKVVQLIATLGTVGAALLAALGYIFTRT